MSQKKCDNKQGVVEVSAEEKETEEGYEYSVCLHCLADSCWEKEIEPMLLSVVKVYGGRTEHRKLRFKMYSDAVKFFYGTCFGKGVRKQLPGCVTGLIRRLAPDKSLTLVLSRLTNVHNYFKD